jgi:hypothetical protein
MKPTMRTIAVLAAVFLLPGCDSGGGSAGPGGGQLVLGDTHPMQPYRAFAGTVRGATLPHGELTGTLGGAPLTAIRLDDTTFSAFVPDVAPGTHALSLLMAGRTLTVPVSVVAGPVIADPSGYLDAAIGDIVNGLDALVEQYADSLRRPTGADADALGRDLAVIRPRLAEAQAALATAAAEERRQAARMVAANADLLGLNGADAGHAGNVSAAGFKLPFCISSSGRGLDTYEECSIELDGVILRTSAKLVVLAAVGALVYAEGLSVVGAIAAGLTAAALYHELSKLHDAVQERFLTPGFARIQEALGSDSRTGAAVAAAAAAGTEFQDGQPATRTVFAEYRSLEAADASTPGLSGLVEGATRVRFMMNAVRAMMFLQPVPPFIPASAVRVVDEVPPQFLSLGAVSAGITGASSAVDGKWQLTFTKPGLSAITPFQFEVRYTGPLTPVQTQQVAAILVPAPVTFRMNNYSFTESHSLALAGGGTCSWTGTFNGVVTVTVTYSDGVGRARGNIEGAIDYPEGTPSGHNGDCSPARHPFARSISRPMNGSSFSGTTASATSQTNWNGTISDMAEVLTGSMNYQWSNTDERGKYQASGGGPFVAPRAAAGQVVVDPTTTVQSVPAGGGNAPSAGPRHH